MSNYVHTECSIHTDKHVCYSWIYILDFVQWQRWPDTVIISRQIWQRKYLLSLSRTPAGKTCVQICFPLVVFKMRLQYWYEEKKAICGRFLAFEILSGACVWPWSKWVCPHRAVSTIILAVRMRGEIIAVGTQSCGTELEHRLVMGNKAFP